MKKENKKIVICIPTCRREKELKRLLFSLIGQENIPDDCTFEILIINNDEENYVRTFSCEMEVSPYVIHCIDVKERGYSNVRNAAVSWVLESDMDALIFVDDDEVVPPNWLSNMMNAWKKHGGDIITGPVLQILPLSASIFVKIFHLLEINSYHKSGEKLGYANSNNTLVSRRVLNAMGPTFHPLLNLSGGEDTLYFHQAHLKGFAIYWDKSISIEEPTLPERATLHYVLYRWFRHGMNRIIINKILYPEGWIKISRMLILKVSVSIIRSFASSIVKLDKRRFGNTVCRFAWLVGSVGRLLGIITPNKIYNK